LLSIGVIKQEETLYFDYFMVKSVKQEHVAKYAKIYGFPLYRNIIKLLAEKQKQKREVRTVRIYQFVYWELRHFIKIIYIKQPNAIQIILFIFKRYFVRVPLS
jgi:hypothetical protein